MPLPELLKTICGSIRSRTVTSKADVRQGVVLALLNELGWPIFDTNIVRPSYSLNGDLVDFALLSDAGVVHAVIIIDSPDKLDVDAVDPSVYITESSAPVVIYTNGLTWSFMPSAPFKGIQSSRIFTIPSGGKTSAERFESLLQRCKVLDGNSQIELARVLANKPVHEADLTAAWLSILGAEDNKLVDLLGEKVAARIGNRPSKEELIAFLRAREPSTENRDLELKDYMSGLCMPLSKSPAVATQESDRSPNRDFVDDQHSIRKQCWYSFGDSRFEVPSAKAVVIGVLRRLENQLPGLIAKCAAHPDNIGTSRRYLGRSPGELYPERPDFASNPGKYAEISSGWLLMTNFNNEGANRIIVMAADVAGLIKGNDFDYSLKLY